MAAQHPFTPSADDETRCGHPLSDAPGYAGGTCGFSAANRGVHAPGAVADRPQRHLTVVRDVPVTRASA